MSDSLRVYVATRHMPPINSGGPGAAARLLMNAIDQSTNSAVTCKLLIGGSLLTRSQLNPPALAQLSPAPGAGPWQWLEQWPGSIVLNAAHMVSVTIQSARVWKALESDLGERPAVTIAFGSSMGQILSMKRPSDRVKLVLSEHSKGGASTEYAVAHPDKADSLLVRRMRRLESETICLSDRVIFPSRGAVELFERAHPEVAAELRDKSLVIHNGIPDPYDASDDRPPTSTEPVILNIAQHVREKGISMAVAGTARYFETGARGRFRNHGGQTALTSQLTQQIQSTQYASRFELSGTVTHSELLEAMRRAWVIVSTPDVAVFDLIILEAMALEKPVIATPVGGNVEALGSDYPLFASDEHEVQSRLQLLNDNLELARDIGKKNRLRFLAHFTTKSFLAKHVALCEELAAGVRQCA